MRTRDDLVRRKNVMLNVSLTPNARILYFLIDDACGDQGKMWWHWRKIALALGLAKGRLFELLKELENASLIARKTVNNRVEYSISQSGKSDSVVRKIGLGNLTDSVPESVPPLPPASGGMRVCGLCLDVPHRITLRFRDEPGQPTKRVWCPECGGNRQQRRA